ncbi:MAG: carboxypeptidase regulatory-like domain-containing protein [Cytophagales bacterium]|nr:carboxypeptidase regulatory-like domain-containing protein [Cytophagales bacterium]
MKYTLLCIILSLHVVVFAQQKVNKLAEIKRRIAIREADKEYNGFRYLDAIRRYEYVLSLDSTYKPGYIKLADCYRRLNNYKKAEERYYIAVTKYDSLPVNIYLEYAQILANNGKFEDSKKMYENYSTKSGNSAAIQPFVKSYSNSKFFYRDSAAYKLMFLSINTGVSDFAPMFYKNGGLVFCSNRIIGDKTFKKVYTYDNSAFLDLFYLDDSTKVQEFKLSKQDSADIAKRRGKILYNDDDTYITSNDSKTLGAYGFNYKDSLGLDAKSNMGLKKFSSAINTKFHEGPIIFTKNYDTAYFTRSNYNKGKKRKSADGSNMLKIYRATRKDTSGGWNVKEVNINSNDYSVGHPALSPDGKRLYFVSDMPGGRGKTDLYYAALKDDGTFDTPVNLGATINTETDEMFPYIDSGYNLYFASNGHGSMGGLDNFKTNIKNGFDNKVVNIGYPINTTYDDFGFIAKNNGQYGFLASNRKRQGTDDDIYMFTYKPMGIKGTVADKRTKEWIEKSTCYLYEASENESLVDTMSTDKEGNFAFNKVEPCKKYKVVSKKNGYTSATKIVSIDCDNPETVTIEQLIEKPDLEVYVYYSENSKPATDANVSIVDVTFDSLKVGDSKTDTAGIYKQKIQVCRKYMVKVSKEGYPSSYKEFSTQCLVAEDVKLNIPLGQIPCMVIMTREKESKQIIPEAKVTFVDKNYNVTFEAVSDANGKLEVFKCPTEKVTIYGEKKDFFTLPHEYTPKPEKRTDTVYFDIPKLKKGMKFALEGILYDYNKFNIRPDAAKILDKVLKVLQDNPTLEIELGSHTDSRGSDKYNFTLSDNRAKSAAAYIVGKGIKKSRIKGQGYGETEILNNCKNKIPCSEDDHQLNRRTEVKITAY